MILVLTQSVCEVYLWVQWVCVCAVKPGSQYVARTREATDFDCCNVIFGHMAACRSE